MGLWGTTKRFVKRSFQSGGSANPINWSAGGTSLHSMGDDITQGIDSATGKLAADRAKASAKALADQQALEEAQNLADQYSNIEKERKKRARMLGRQSTILAGGNELGGNSLNVMRQTLLGG
jgi:hypothetical protein